MLTGRFDEICLSTKDKEKETTRIDKGEKGRGIVAEEVFLKPEQETGLCFHWDVGVRGARAGLCSLKEGD